MANILHSPFHIRSDEADHDGWAVGFCGLSKAADLDTKIRLCLAQQSGTR